MRSTLLTAVALTSLLAATGCTKDPTEGKAVATVAEAQPVQAEAKAAPAKVQIDTLALTPANSKIGFVGAKVTAEHVGEFKEFEGKVSVLGGAMTQLQFTVKPASMVVDAGKAPKLEEHLKSPDFLDVATHPEAKFVSTKIAANPEGEFSHTVTGNLELRGTTRSVTFPANITINAEGVKAKTEFGINRKDFKIEYPGMPDDLIKDNVLLKIEIDLPRNAA